MDSTTQFTIILLVQIAGFLSLYLNSYFTEKGKNKAAKEDSAKLTEIVETVKNELSHKQNVKSSVYQDRKAAAQKFLKVSQVWVKFIEKINPFEKFGADGLTKVEIDFDKLREDVKSAWLDFDLFLTDKDLKGLYYEWLQAVTQEFRILRLFLDRANTYYDKENSFQDDLGKYALDPEHIAKIRKSHQLDRDKYDSDCENYLRLNEPAEDRGRRINSQLIEQLSQVVMDRD